MYPPAHISTRCNSWVSNVPVSTHSQYCCREGWKVTLNSLWLHLPGPIPKPYTSPTDVILSSCFANAGMGLSSKGCYLLRKIILYIISFDSSFSSSFLQILAGILFSDVVATGIRLRTESKSGPAFNPWHFPLCPQI